MNRNLLTIYLIIAYLPTNIRFIIILISYVVYLLFIILRADHYPTTMKKILLTILLSTTILLNIHAQLSLIPKVGLTRASFNYSDDVAANADVRGVTGFLIGAGLNAPLTKFISVQPEFYLIQKGSYREWNIFGSTATYKEKLNYLEVPVLIKASYDLDELTIYANTGPYIAFALGGRYKGDGNVAGISYDGEGKIKFADKPSNANSDVQYYENDNVRRTDFGWQFGAGIGYKAGPGKVILDLRYGLGIANFAKEPDNAANNYDNTSKHRAFAISVGYAIPLGK